jgi:uncharacterized MAPEG superfamily protein
VPLDRQRQFVGRHAAAIIGDRDQPLAAFLQRDVDARGAGIDRVLDQFFDCRSRALDDLARRDEVDEGSAAEDGSPSPEFMLTKGVMVGTGGRRRNLVTAAKPGIAARALGAHINGIETFPFFAAALLLAEFRHQPQHWIDLLAVTFLAVRVAFVLAYLGNWSTTRTLLWNLGFFVNAAIFFMPWWGPAVGIV